MPRPPKSERPSEVFARRLREVREARRWTQQDMADRLGEMGEPVDRATIARAENRNRGISLDDAVAWSAALGVSLLHMIVPLEETPDVSLTSKVRMAPAAARRWFRGYEALRVEDVRTVMSERPPAESGAVDTLMWAAQKLAQQVGTGAAQEVIARQLDALEHSLALVANEQGGD